MSVSCVCAIDNTNATCVGDNACITIDVDNITVPGTYDDLNNDIQNIVPGSVYDVTRDYKFNGKGQTIILEDRIITISQDNILINGNGHTIDAGGSQNFAIFKILGNNVTIKDLNFINSEPGSIAGPSIYDQSRYQKVLSPICWYGNDGVMQGCNFYNDCSVNGGAVTWMGDNGTIDNCIFENNTARGVGGALYIGGTNNTVSNCQFINSSSQLSGEAVYVDRNRKGINFINDTAMDTYPLIDGAVVGLDVNYLYYSHMVYAYGNITTGEGKKINIIPTNLQIQLLG